MLYKKPKIVKKAAIGVKKVTVSLPPDVLADLDHVAAVVGLSRSAFLSSLLGQSLPQTRAAVDALARYNAQSRDAIDSFMKKLISGGQDDLFNRE